MYDIDPQKMYDAGQRALAASRELQQAAEHFSRSQVDGQAPVVTRANRRARRHAKALQERSDDLAAAAHRHTRSAQDVAREQKKPVPR